MSISFQLLWFYLDEELQLNEPSSSAEPDPATVDLEDDSERRSQGEASEPLSMFMVFLNKNSNLF